MHYEHTLYKIRTFAVYAYNQQRNGQIKFRQDGKADENYSKYYVNTGQS